MYIRMRGAAKVTPTLVVNSANQVISHSSPSSLAPDVWRFLVFPYGGSGRATGADGINIYINGPVRDGTAGNHPSYGDIEDEGGFVRLGQRIEVRIELFAGQMAGSPIGTFFAQTEMTASQVTQMYGMGRTALGLPWPRPCRITFDRPV